MSTLYFVSYISVYVFLCLRLVRYYVLVFVCLAYVVILLFLLICLDLVALFFFFKQKTAYEMRISDWSSDVCSSDLFRGRLRGDRFGRRLRSRSGLRHTLKLVEPGLQRFGFGARGGGHLLHRLEFLAADEIHAADEFLRAIAHRGFGFAASAGDGPGDAVHHLGEVVEKAVFALHVHIPSSGMSPCCPLRRHLIWVLAAAGTRVSASGLRWSI